MKTLSQLDAKLDPRTPINATNTPGDVDSIYRINSAGSYYLTANFTGVSGKSGIVIAASGVTLDLMGFELAGVAGSVDGVQVFGGRNNIAIRNGTLRNWGSDGVDAVNATNGQYQDLRLSANAATGLSCGPNSMLVNCTAQSNGGTGFNATGDSCTVSGCTAQSNSGNGISTALGSNVSGCVTVANTVHGISVGGASTISACSTYINQSRGITTGDSCTITGCTVRSNGLDGIDTGFDCTITGCTVRRNDGAGIVASTGNTVIGCTVAFNGSDGIYVLTDCQVRNNNCRQNGRTSSFASGIVTQGSQNRIDENQVTGNSQYGIRCQVGGNVITRNVAGANGSANWNILGLNSFGPVVGLADPITTTSPWANFNSP
jgi:parallel beta-helix repeat protein